MTLNICMNYGGRDEIAQAARNLAMQVKEGTLQPEDITVEALSGQMYSAGQKDPDFTRADLDAAIEEFHRRSRRFGGV